MSYRRRDIKRAREKHGKKEDSCKGARGRKREKALMTVIMAHVPVRASFHSFSK